MRLNQLIRILLMIAFMVQSSAGYAVTLGQIDTFEDGTTRSWAVGSLGAQHPAPPTNIPLGGPAGLADRYLLLQSFSTEVAGSRLSVVNRTQWSGDYLAAGVDIIVMDLRNLGTRDLNLRLLLSGRGPGFSPLNQALSANPVFLPAGSGWIRVEFPVTIEALTAVTGDVAEALTNAFELRIIHNPLATFPPPAVDARVGVDNLTAIAEIASPLPVALFSGQRADIAMPGAAGEFTAVSSSPAIATATVSGQRVTIIGESEGGTAQITISDTSVPTVTMTIPVTVTAASVVGGVPGAVTRAATTGEQLSLLLHIGNTRGVSPEQIAQEWFVAGFGPISTGIATQIVFITMQGTVVPLGQAVNDPAAVSFDFNHAEDTYFIGSVAIGAGEIAGGDFLIYGYAFSTTAITDFGNAPDLVIENFVRLNVE